MHKQIANLHYLTQDLPHYTHEEQVQIACKNEIKWIQLRVKNKEFSEWMTIAERIREITFSFNVTLIINDNVEVAKRVNADGIHLGQDDMSWREAKKNLGEEKIIGLSAHSISEILEAKNAMVDYFGLGPFQFTSTKDRLHPILGKEGISKIIKEARQAGIMQPVIAIGGIQLDHVAGLIDGGANGIAVSSAINLSQNPKETIRNFLGQLESINNRQETLSTCKT